MTNPFWKSPVYGVIKAMKATGNQPGIIQQWVELARQWALENPGPDADAILAWVPHFQARPFYTAAELAPIFPALIVALGLAERPPRYSVKRLEHLLDYGGLPRLTENPNYFIVERIKRNQNHDRP